jgi:hypothetical protein
MRSTVKITLAALTGLALIYSSCSKSVTGPAPSTKASANNTQAISKQIASNFVKALKGTYGGANIGDGIKAPNRKSTANKGPRINSVTPYCGFTIDTALYFTVLLGDTTKTVDSKYKFIYTCSAGSLDGYVLTDSITYTEKGTLFLNKYLTAQNYIVNNISSDFSVVSLHGSIGTAYDTDVFDNAQTRVAYGYTHTQYYLNGLSINVAGSAPNITAGTVNFSSNIIYLENGNTVTGGFAGSLTFLGNNMANMSVTYNGVTTLYSYNLLTNDMQPI